MSDHEIILKATVLAWSHRTRTGVNADGKQWLIIELGRREFRLPVIDGLPTIDENDRASLIHELTERTCAANVKVADSTASILHSMRH